MKTKPIKSFTLFRNILGRIGDYRGVRIYPVTGTIVGIPYGVTNEYTVDNLLSHAVTFDDAGAPSIRVFYSDGETTNAFDPTEPVKAQHQYVASLFVKVRPTGGDVDGTDDVVCVHLITETEEDADVE